MSDLIDLNSPDVKGQSNPKLATPLIPAPSIVESSSEANPQSATGKRESLGSNPFDRVLHETAEYVSRKGDPFEVMLQRALKSKSKNTERTHSVDFMDDFTPIRRNRYHKMVNRTLDALDRSMLEDKLGPRSKDRSGLKGESVVTDARSAVCDNNVTEDASIPKQSLKIIVTDSHELSILSHSAMNDTLSPALLEEDGDVSPVAGRDALTKLTLPTSNNFTLLNQCSLSQGNAMTPKLSCRSKRSQSLMDENALQSGSSTASLLDRGFLESRQSNQSVFSSLSNVSSIKFSSATYSNDTINLAFLDSGSMKTSRERLNTTSNSEEAKIKQCDLSDLTERLNKLKYSINGTNSLSNITEDKSNSTKEENNKQTSDKLIEVDVFLPEQNTKQHNESSISTSSSDSVFTDASRVNKSIIIEAKALAKTFKELSPKTDSSFGADDFISNNTLWMSELLPAFDDEPVVDNLIELPVSPDRKSKDTRSNDKKQSVTNSKANENFVKEIESEFTVSTLKETKVTSLLSDLKKLIKAENNLEANKLLDNLEEVLDVNCKNNTELLMTYLNISNGLHSSQKTSSDIVEGSGKTNTDKSEEENGRASSEKTCNSAKLSPDVNDNIEDISQPITVSDDSSSVKPSSCADDSRRDNRLDIVNSLEANTSRAEQDIQPDEKLAVKLLMNLGKLLSGQGEGDATVELLKNIGKALNVASDNSKIDVESEARTDSKVHKVQRITLVKTSESDRGANSMKPVHRRSFELRSKPLEKTNRRSVSVIDSSSGVQVRKHRDTYKLNGSKKLLSNEPDFSQLLSNKKTALPEACNARKAEIAQPNARKEKSIAISDVKSKLKKKSDVINKRGPMKAVHPVDSMQKKRASLGKTISSSRTTTPPKIHKSTPSRGKIISSTPNSVENNYYVPKKSAKPIASSTPDGQNSKALTTQPLTPGTKKRNFSCDFSPVTTHVNMSNSDERKDSPKRLSKLPTPKKCTTPKRQQGYGIPRYSTPPRCNSSSSMKQSPQRLSKSMTDFRCSPVCDKKSAEKTQQSPLKESNRDSTKVKPYKLISRLRRHNTGDFAEKENNYA